MRDRLFNLPAVARALVFALVAVAIVAAALHFRTGAPRFQAMPAGLAADPDPLAAELQRCQVLATRAKDDAGCEAAWAENRRRFFTYPSPPSTASPPAASPKPSDR